MDRVGHATYPPPHRYLYLIPFCPPFISRVKDARSTHRFRTFMVGCAFAFPRFHTTAWRCQRSLPPDSMNAATITGRHTPLPAGLLFGHYYNVVPPPLRLPSPPPTPWFGCAACRPRILPLDLLCLPTHIRSSPWLYSVPAFTHPFSSCAMDVTYWRTWYSGLNTRARMRFPLAFCPCRVCNATFPRLRAAPAGFCTFSLGRAGGRFELPSASRYPFTAVMVLVRSTRVYATFACVSHRCYSYSVPTFFGLQRLPLPFFITTVPTTRLVVYTFDNTARGLPAARILAHTLQVPTFCYSQPSGSGTTPVPTFTRLRLGDTFYSHTTIAPCIPTAFCYTRDSLQALQRSCNSHTQFTPHAFRPVF